jgi:hypothetical protein
MNRLRRAMAESAEVGTAVVPPRDDTAVTIMGTLSLCDSGEHRQPGAEETRQIRDPVLKSTAWLDQGGEPSSVTTERVHARRDESVPSR